MADESLTNNISKTLRDAFEKALTQEHYHQELYSLQSESADDNPNVLPEGRVSIYGSVEVKKSVEKKKRKKAWKDFLLLEHIRQTYVQLQERIAYHQEMMESYLEQLQETALELALLDAQCAILEAELEHFQKTGAFALDENGQLLNKDAAAIIAEWEQRTGERIDLSSPTAYRDVFGVLVEIESERNDKNEDLTRQTEAYEHHKEKWEEAQDLKDDLESDDPEERQTALLKTRQLLEKSPYDYQPKSTTAASSSDVNNLPLSTDPEEVLTENISFGFAPLKKEF